MKSSKVFSSTLIIVAIVFCSLLLSSSSTIKKSNTENINELNKQLVEFKNELIKLKKTTTYGTNPIIGEVSLFAGNYAPRGWAYCDGQILKIEKNTALFSILGVTYGGDGRTTFALPKLNEGKTGDAKYVKYIISLQGNYPSRN